jgi:hypothetical protein
MRILIRWAMADAATSDPEHLMLVPHRPVEPDFV